MLFILLFDQTIHNVHGVYRRWDRGNPYQKNLKWNSAGQLGFCEVVVSDEATGKKSPFHALSSQTMQRLNGICNFIGFALPV